MTDTAAEPVVIRLGASRSITVAVGSLVLVRSPDGGSYGAVIEAIGECDADLTFTPPGTPRNIPLGLVLCAVDGGAKVDPSSVPRHQPLPNRMPIRRRRAEADVSSMR